MVSLDESQLDIIKYLILVKYPSFGTFARSFVWRGTNKPIFQEEHIASIRKNQFQNTERALKRYQDRDQKARGPYSNYKPLPESYNIFDIVQQTNSSAPSLPQFTRLHYYKQFETTSNMGPTKVSRHSHRRPEEEEDDNVGHEHNTRPSTSRREPPKKAYFDKPAILRQNVDVEGTRCDFHVKLEFDKGKCCTGFPLYILASVANNGVKVKGISYNVRNLLLLLLLEDLLLFMKLTFSFFCNLT